MLCPVNFWDQWCSLLRVIWVDWFLVGASTKKLPDYSSILHWQKFSVFLFNRKEIPAFELIPCFPEESNFYEKKKGPPVKFFLVLWHKKLINKKCDCTLEPTKKNRSRRSQKFPMRKPFFWKFEFKWIEMLPASANTLKLSKMRLSKSVPWYPLRCSKCFSWIYLQKKSLHPFCKFQKVPKTNTIFFHFWFFQVGYEVPKSHSKKFENGWAWKNLGQKIVILCLIFLSQKSKTFQTSKVFLYHKYFLA